MNNAAVTFYSPSSGLFHKCIKFSGMAFSSGTSIRIANRGNLCLSCMHNVEIQFSIVATKLLSLSDVLHLTT